MSTTGFTPTSLYGSTCFPNHANNASGRTSLPVSVSFRGLLPSGPGNRKNDWSRFPPHYH